VRVVHRVALVFGSMRVASVAHVTHAAPVRASWPRAILIFFHQGQSRLLQLTCQKKTSGKVCTIFSRIWLPDHLDLMTNHEPASPGSSVGMQADLYLYAFFWRRPNSSYGYPNWSSSWCKSLSCITKPNNSFRACMLGLDTNPGPVNFTSTNPATRCGLSQCTISADSMMW